MAFVGLVKVAQVSGVACVAVQCSLNPFSNVSNLFQDLVSVSGTMRVMQVVGVVG